MVALNFMPQFAADVASGKKRQTIRENTKAISGCQLQLYTGQRTKSCRKIGEGACISVQRLIMMATGVQPQGNTFIAGYRADDFARADGFKDYADMWAFFAPRANADGHFIGYLIRW